VQKVVVNFLVDSLNCPYLDGHAGNSPEQPTFSEFRPRSVPAPTSGFSRAIRRISSRSSYGTSGRPARDFHRHQSRKPARCQRISVSGRTTISAERQSNQRDRNLNVTRVAALLAHANAGDVRKIAALLNIQYRQLPDGNYNHSNVISLLSPQGEVVRQSSVLGKADEALLQALTSLATKSSQP
jgi:hypothetical protein